MTSWNAIFKRRRATQSWDAGRHRDETVIEIKALFEDAREDAPEPDPRLWEKLRPRLAAHEARDPRYFLSLAAAVAHAGPRFAAAALAVLLLVAGLVWSQDAGRTVNFSAPQTNLMAGLENPLELSGNILETQTGQELLQYVAYGSTDRQTWGRTP